MSRRHLILRLDAPLMSFGDVAIDAHGPTSPWPHTSQLAGLIANALGWNRTDLGPIQHLQDRLTFACRADREGDQALDYQTAEIAHADRGWTTRGSAEGRAGGANTYKGAHIRRRHYWASRVVTVALRIDSDSQGPGLERIADALNRPARPLFIGRKPFLPAAPIVAGAAAAESALASLVGLPLDCPDGTGTPRCTACAPANDPPHPFVDGNARVLDRYGRRDWENDVHAGKQRWLEGLIAPRRPS